MRKIILMCFVLVVAVFARTETIELTGEFSEQLGNPFKKVLNVNKTETINIYSQDKDVVLKVESNLRSESIYQRNPHPDTIVLKNKSVEKVVEDFYSEDFIVKHSSKNAVVVNIESGTVSLNYNDVDHSQVHHLIGVEVSLVISIEKDGRVVKKEVVMDHKLGKVSSYKGFVTSDDFDFSSLNVAYSKKIIEYEIYKVLKDL